MMIYRTLHAYILRELLRVFLLTASTLTTLLAFGGMFRPLTKQGIDISQVMVLMFNLMPAMLAYAIPIAALFAAVLVYWRMSTDNELTACRAGGVSFLSIVLPAFILGIAVASMDLVFVNYVVPRFLQSTERAVRSDLASWIVSQVGRGDKFQYEALPLIVTADSAEQGESPDANTSVVVLHGMAASFLDHGRPTFMAVAQEATVKIRNNPEQDSADLTFNLKNGSAFDPNNGFRKGTGSVEDLPFVLPIPSYFKSKAKYLNWKDLDALYKNPSPFPPVEEIINRMQTSNRYKQISENVQAWWSNHSRSETGVQFEQADSSGGKSLITLYAAQSQINLAAAPEECLTFSAKTPGGVKVEIRKAGRLETTYRADFADLVLAPDRFIGTDITGQLRLHGTITRENNASQVRPTPEISPTSISGLILDPSLKNVATFAGDDKINLIRIADDSPYKGMNDLARQAHANINKLYQSITSELHSRGSFSLSCLTLVMLGAALGILLHGKNPLAVFVVGFVPAIILVLLITAGRQLTEGDPKNTVAGITMIWAGNGILLALVVGVYAKLLRR